MKHVLRRFVRDESGATAIEYGLIAAIIAVGLNASLHALQGNQKTTLEAVGTAVKDAK